MTAIEVKKVLGDNREIVINFFGENVKTHNFYTLGWFMTRVLVEATASWQRRRNITEKEIMSVLNRVMKNYPQIAKNYVSNYQKAVDYFGKEKVTLMYNTL